MLIESCINQQFTSNINNMVSESQQFYYNFMYFRQTAPSPEKVKIFQSKLLAVDTHIKTSEKLPQTLFMHPQLLDHMYTQKPAYQIKNKLKLKESKSIIFKDFNSVVFEFQYQELEADRNYCLHLDPDKILLSVKIIYDGQRKRYYEIKKVQTILLSEKDWKKAQITIVGKKINNISMIKVEMDTIKVQFKAKNSQSIPPQKKIVEKQLEEYIQKNLTRKKIKQIIQKRKSKSLSRLCSGKSVQLSSATGLRNRNGSLTAFRSTSTQLFSPVMELGLNQRKIQSAQTKRDFVQFQEGKRKYLKHLNKMSPQKSKQLQKQKIKYDSEKINNLKSLSKIMYAVKFLKQINLSGVQISRKKMEGIQTKVLCKKFYRNLAKANKLRLPYRNRNKTSTGINLKAICCILQQKNVDKAQIRLVQCFSWVMFKNDVKRISEKCEKYHNEATKIQKFLKKKRQIYIERFTVLSENVKGRIFENKKQKMECFWEYMNVCKAHKNPLKYSFIIHHKQIDSILLKFRGDESQYEKFADKN